MYSTSAYVAVSLSVAILIRLGISTIAGAPFRPQPEFANTLSPKLSKYAAWFLLGSGALGVIADLVLALGMLPANPDSVVYRFPRAYWYLGHGALTHVTNVADPRVLFYPFNGTMLYLPLIHFQLPPQSFSFPSIVCWLAIIGITYLFARDVGAPRLFAAAAASLIAFTPNVLIQSLSTNDEIIAASALLAGLYFLHRWTLEHQVFDGIVGMVGVAISVGTKLHVMFYWPLLSIIAVFVLHNFRVAFAALKNVSIPRNMMAAIVAILVSSVFAFSFVGYNYLSAGELTAWDFNNQILNRPFNWLAGLQNVVLYTCQIILTPIADLHVAPNSTFRAHYYELFNQIFSPLFFWVNNGPAFTSASYRFTGVNSPSAVSFNEQTVFIGFTWLVAALSGMWLLRQWRDSKLTWSRFHLASLPVWIITFAISTRYIEGFSVYLGFATIVAAPSFVFAFSPIRHRLLSLARWIILGAVVSAHFFFAIAIFLSSSPRNLIVMLRAPNWPVSRAFSIENSVQTEIGRSTAGLVNRSIAWGQPFWATMYSDPQVRQFLASNPSPIPVPANAAADAAAMELRYSRYVVMPRADDPRLHLFLFPQIPLYGHTIPVRIRDKSSSGVVLIGDIGFAFGPEWVFAAGNEVESRFPGRDKYVLLTFRVISDVDPSSDWKIVIPPIVYGLSETDKLSFRVELKVDGLIVGSSEWQASPSIELATSGLNVERGVLSVLVRNDGAGGTVYSTDVSLQSTKPLLLQPRTN